MNNLIEYLRELFTKPIICWSTMDYVIATVLVVACLLIIFAVLGAICGFIDWLKKRKNRNKKGGKRQ